MASYGVVTGGQAVLQPNARILHLEQQMMDDGLGPDPDPDPAEGGRGAEEVDNDSRSRLRP